MQAPRQESDDGLQQLWAVNRQRMAWQQVPLLRGNLDGRGNRCAGPGVRGGADVVEGMMFYVYTTDGKDYQRMPLSELADALRPLLAAQAAPEEVDLREQVHGLTQRLATVEAERDEWRDEYQVAAQTIARARLLLDAGESSE